MLKRQLRFPASNRLNHPSVYSTELFTARFTSNNRSSSRFGFVAGKTLDKRATVRNRVRRIFRSCLEERLSCIVPGYDMLFFLKRGIIGKEKEDICKEVEKFLTEKRLFLSKQNKAEEIKK